MQASVCEYTKAELNPLVHVHSEEDDTHTDRQQEKHTFLARQYITSSRETCIRNVSRDGKAQN